LAALQFDESEKFMRLFGVIAALVVIAPLAAGAAVAQPLPLAFQGQTWWGGRPNTPSAGWCLNLNSGADRVEEDCSFTSYRACRFALGNANNGFCTQSYAYADVPPPPPPRKGKKKRRAQY
jgi:hypothetical protein